jgi:hypothetical protein
MNSGRGECAGKSDVTPVFGGLNRVGALLEQGQTELHRVGAAIESLELRCSPALRPAMPDPPIGVSGRASSGLDRSSEPASAVRVPQSALCDRIEDLAKLAMELIDLALVQQRRLSALGERVEV